MAYSQSLYAIAPEAHGYGPSCRSFTCHRTPGHATARVVHTRTSTCNGRTKYRAHPKPFQELAFAAAPARNRFPTSEQKTII
jgi:hypothetical protein